MGLLGNLSDAEETLKASGAVNSGTDSYQDVANIAWDLSSLNYEAKGPDGWLNRGLGLTALANPLAWASTLSGVWQNETARNPDDNALELAWKIGTGTLWGVVGGQLKGLQGFYEGAKSLSMAGILGGQKLIDDMQGVTSTVPEGDVWDLSKTYDIGMGELLAYGVGQASRAVTGLTGDELYKQSGLEFLRSDFDVFDKTDTDLFEKDGQLNILTQGGNFAFEILLDPSTYLGLGTGAVSKVVRGSYGLTKKGVIRAGMKAENAMLQKVVAGEATRMDSTLDDLLKFDSGYANQFLKARGVQGQALDSMSYLIGAANKDRADVADIFLAVQHGDRAAQIRLVNKYGELGEFPLTIDAANGGGKIIRSLNDETFEYAFKNNLEFGDAYNKALGNYIKEAESEADRFLKNLNDLTIRTDEAGENAVALNVNRMSKPIVSQGAVANIPIVGEVLGTVSNNTVGAISDQISRAATRFKTIVLEDTGQLTRIGIIPQNSQLPRIIKTIRKVSMSALNGYVDLNDIGTSATSKLLSMIDEADRASGGAMRSLDPATGKSLADDLMDSYRSAVDPKSKRDAILNFEKQSFVKIAESKGVSDDLTKRLWEDMADVVRVNQDKLVQSYKEGNHAIYQGSYEIELDDVAELMSQTENAYQTIPFLQVAKAVDHYGRDMLMHFDKAQQYSGDALRFFNSMWSFGILMRPARFFRERMANSIGIVLSGLSPQVWFSDNYRGMVKNSVSNIYTGWKRGRQAKELSKSIWDADATGNIKVASKSVKNIVSNDTQTLSRVNKSIEQIDNFTKEQLDIIENDYISGGTGVFDEAEHIKFEEANTIISSKDTFHGSSSMPSTWNDNEFVATTSSLDDAKVYARQSANPSKIDDALSEEDYAAVKASIDNKIIRAENNITNIEERISRAETIKQVNDVNVENGIIPPVTAGKSVVEINIEIDKALEAKDYDTVRSILFDPNTPFEVIDAAVQTIGLSVDSQLKIISLGNISREGINHLVKKGKNSIVREAAGAALEGKKYVSSSADNVKATIAKKPVVVENVADLKNQLKSAKTKLDNLRKESDEVSKKTTFVADSTVDDGIDPYAKRIINQTADNEVIQYRLKGREKWSTVSKEELATWDSKKVQRYEFEKMDSTLSPKHTKITTVGDDADLSSYNVLSEELRSILGVNSKAEFDELVSSGAIRKHEGLKQWANDNNVGRLKIVEGDKETFLSLPKFIETADYNPAQIIAKEKVAAKVDRLSKKIEERGNQYIAIRNREELLKFDYDVKSYMERIRTSKDLNMEERLQLIAQAQTKANEFRQVTQRIDNRIQKLRNFIDDSTSWKKRQGQGIFTISTQSGDVYLPDYLNGPEGTIALDMAAASDYGRELLKGLDILRGTGGKIKEVHINPSDPYYWEMFSGYLKYFAKNDASFNLIAKKIGMIDPNLSGEAYQAALGSIKTEMVSWLKTNPAGIKYANAYKLGNKQATLAAKVDGPGEYDTFEEFVDMRIAQVTDELYDPAILNAYNSGDFTKLDSDSLRTVMEGRELKTVTGRNAATGQKVAALSTVKDVMRKANKWLVEDPQTFLENVPMARSFYKQRFEELYNLNAVDGKLDINGINGIRKIAYQDSINEMRKWLYNVQNKTKLTDSLGTLVPFITAYTFTNRMMVRALKENPAGVLWLMSMGNKTVGQLNYIDAEGNPTDIGGAQALVIPIAKPVREVFSKLPFVGEYLKDVSNLNFSMKSLNVWYGGEIIPGVGPLASIATNEFVKAFPTAAYNVNDVSKPFIPGEEGLINWILPFGTQDNIFKQLSPTWANQLAEIAPTLFGQEGGSAYVDSFGKVMAFESARYAVNPEEYQAPNEQQIREQVNGLWILKMFTSLASPASYQPKTEADMYRKIHRQLTDRYGKDEADWLFMTKYPEYVGAITGSTSNEYGLDPNMETFNGLENMQGVKEIFQYGGDEAKDMMGWAMNISGTGDYDQWVYNYLTDQSSGVGEGKYYDVLTPAEMQDKAKAAPGWIQFKHFMALLDAEAIDRGVPIEQDKQLSAYKTAYIKQLKEKFPEWATAYGTINSTKFNQRADVVEQLMLDGQFMGMYGNRKGIQYINQYIDLRKDVKEQLRSTGTTLASNKEAKRILDAFVLESKGESLEFSEWYNRYFDGDTVI